MAGRNSRDWQPYACATPSRAPPPSNGFGRPRRSINLEASKGADVWQSGAQGFMLHVDIGSHSFLGSWSFRLGHIGTSSKSNLHMKNHHTGNAIPRRFFGYHQLSFLFPRSPDLLSLIHSFNTVCLYIPLSRFAFPFLEYSRLRSEVRLDMVKLFLWHPLSHTLLK